MRNSSQNLDMFQCVSTYDTANKIGHMYLLYICICKISRIFETGNIALEWTICMKVNFRAEKNISNLRVYNVLLASDIRMTLLET